MTTALLQRPLRSAATAAPVFQQAKPLLEVKGLTTEFTTHDGVLRAVNDVSLKVEPGKVLAILGESGSGKSMLLRTVLGIQPKSARTSGQVLMNDRDLLQMDAGERERIRGTWLAMIFQDPMRHPLDPSRKPMLALPESRPRKPVRADGPIGGVPGDLWDTGEQLRLGTLSVDDIVSRASQRIAAHSDRLHAFEHVANVEAIAAAMAKEAASGQWRGPLHGLPVSIKDIIDVEGMPTTGSSRALPARPAEQDGWAVNRLRAAGALLMGKTVTHEFALGVTTPQSHNPWDESRIPGGSSGGSAISIVTGMALASLGTDTRASIRVPAALSCTVGFRPTTGVVPVDRWLTLSWSLDVLAPMARSVRDIALLMDVLTASGQIYRNALPGRLEGMRVAYSEAFLTGAEPGVASLFEDGLQAVTRAGGQVVRSNAPTSDDVALANTAGMIVSRAEAAQAHLEAGTVLELCTDEVGGQLSEAGNVLATDYLRCLRIRDELYERFVSLFDDADLLIMPTSKVVAPPRPDADRYLMALSENCIAWSLLGMPAVSLYAGMSDGLPVGVQLVAAPGQDAFLLAAAHALEARLPPMPEWRL